MTVSRALQGKTANMRPETFERVRKTADEMGYVKDHRISQLATYLADQRRGTMIQGELAYLHLLNPGYKHEGRNQYFFRILHNAAKHYGYRVEPYAWSGVTGLGSTEAQLERMWDARGVKGVFIGPQTSPAPPRLTWGNYSWIAVGDSLQHPELHRVDSDFRQATMDCCLELHRLGYQRIGLMATYGYDRAMRFSIRGGYEAFHYKMRTATRLDMLGDDLPADGDRFEKPLRAWIAEQRPDVIVGDSQLYAKLLEMGYSIPSDFAFASWLAEPSRDHGVISGIFRAEETLAKTSVELLVSQINHGVRGIPKDPIQTKIEGHWQSRKTTR